MDRRSLPLLIIVALVSGAIGWFLHTPSALTEATPAPASKPMAASTPAVPATQPPKQVAAPVAAPAPVVASARASTPAMPPAAQPATPANAAPAAASSGTTPPELASVITELSTLAASGDLVALYENYMPPQKVAAFTPEQKAFIEDQIRKQTEGPNGAKVIQGQVAIIQSLSTVTPTMNAAGDHATFQVPTPKDIAPAGANLPPTIPINFVKIDGRWYLDQ